MGMTINNSIRILEDYHKWEKQYGIFGSGVDDATNKLLEIAKKYQKIEEIILSDDDTHYALLMQIREVIEDENVD